MRPSKPERGVALAAPSRHVRHEQPVRPAHGTAAHRGPAVRLRVSRPHTGGVYMYDKSDENLSVDKTATSGDRFANVPKRNSLRYRFQYFPAHFLGPYSDHCRRLLASLNGPTDRHLRGSATDLSGNPNVCSQTTVRNHPHGVFLGGRVEGGWAIGVCPPRVSLLLFSF